MSESMRTFVPSVKFVSQIEEQNDQDLPAVIIENEEDERN